MEQKSTGVWAGGFFVKQSNSSEAETGARSVWDQELGASTAAGAFAATPPPPPLKRTAHTQTKKKCVYIPSSDKGVRGRGEGMERILDTITDRIT